jgi:hypothetical protein
MPTTFKPQPYNPQQVMELCGGKLGELSKLEIQKRDDLSEAEK